MNVVSNIIDDWCDLSIQPKLKLREKFETKFKRQGMKLKFTKHIVCLTYRLSL